MKCLRCDASMFRVVNPVDGSAKATCGRCSNWTDCAFCQKCGQFVICPACYQRATNAASQMNAEKDILESPPGVSSDFRF